ncbi:hypothetical protein [Heyndrickxia ginsengihumi]|uniref:hypothetical protein n=1 Tax=Heyndrickxia ginsengihumi TaxID=363870 RepID=UPI003D1C0A68
MKLLTTIILSLITVIVLLTGNFYWQDRTQVNHFTSESANGKAVSNDDLIAETAHWPKQAQSDFKQALKDGKTYKIAIVGSKAMGTTKKGWAHDLKQALLHTYEHVSVSLFPYDVNSDQFIASNLYKKVADAQPNLVLFEPFILNDNGAVDPENAHQDLLTAVDSWKDAVTIIQPSYPLYQATNYPEQVSQLKKFVKAHKLVYLDHWEKWPDTNSEALKNDLKFENGEQVGPNAKGNAIWYHYVRDYFIAD